MDEESMMTKHLNRLIRSNNELNLEYLSYYIFKDMRLVKKGLNVVCVCEKVIF